MASLFGDVEDLFNDQIYGENDLPSGDEGNGGRDDENAEGALTTDQPVKVEPKKIIHRTRQKLTVETLSGPRGIHTIEQYFKDHKFKGKGHEKQDLDEVLRRLQHWGHRLYPNYKFEDILTNIERLAKKKPLQVHMSRYRLGMLEEIQNRLNDNDIVDDNDAGVAVEDEPFDEFDALLNEQIAISRVDPAFSSKSATPAGRNINTPSTLATPSFSRGNIAMSTPFSGVHNLDISDLAEPLPPSLPSTPPQTPTLTSDQLALIAENRRKAQERLRAKKMEQSQRNATD